MSAFIKPVITAIIIFPILAAFFTIPYAVYQYRKLGSISRLKTFVVYAFIFYMLSAYFLVILPLPPIEFVRTLKTQTMNLIPFNFIHEFINENPNGFSLSLGGLKEFLKARTVQQPVFNVILTVPFGIFLKYIWNFNLKKVAISSFILSLFYELTQLTGLYFIYPRPYRLFDVDDLMLNTLGGIIGFIIAPIFIKWLPSIKSLDQKEFESRYTVSFYRRSIALILDLFIFFPLTKTILNVIPAIFKIRTNDNILDLTTFIIYFILVPLFFKRTFGMSLIKIKIFKNSNSKLPYWISLIIRQVGLYYIALRLPFIIINWSLNNIVAHQNQIILWFAVIIGVLIFILFIAIDVISLILKRDMLMFYEKWSRTHLEGTD